jgi:hypothetical protein
VTSTVAGAFTVTVTLDDGGPGLEDVPATGNTLARFVPGSPDPGTSTLSVSRIEMLAGETTTATVRVLDANRSPILGASVHLWTDEPMPSGGDWDLTTGAGGVVVQDISTTQAGTYNLHASVGTSTADISGSPVAITFKPRDVDPDESSFSVSQHPDIVADGEHYQTVTVTLKDEFGNAVVPLVGTISVVAMLGEIPATVAPVVPSEVPGDYLVDLSAMTAGTYAVGVQYTRPGGPGSQTIEHGTNNRFALFVPGRPSTTTSSLASSRQFVEANGTDSSRLTVTLADENGNPIGQGGDDIGLRTSVGQVGPVTDHGDGTYTAEVTSTSAGRATISFTIEGVPSSGPPPRTQVVEFIATPATPVPYYATANKVVATAQPGTVVSVYAPDGLEICHVATLPTGVVECQPLQPAQAHEARLTLTASEPHGFTSAPAGVVVDALPPDPPNLDPSDGSVIYGDSEPGSHIVVTDEDGEVLCEADADADDGTWSCEPNRHVNDGEELEAVAVDPVGNTSTQTIIVADQSRPAAPTVDPSNGTTISGKGLPGYLVTVVFPDGQSVTTRVGQDGNWSLKPPPNYNPAHAHELQISQETEFNRVQVKTSFETPLILDRMAPDKAQPAPTGGTTLTGKGEAGAAVRVTAPNGIELATGTVDAAGNWSVTLPPSVAVGDMVRITLTDAAGNVSDAFDLRVGLIAVAVDRPTVTVGETVTFTVSNLQPAERATGIVHSTPLTLGAALADINGATVYSWTVGPEAELGVHTFQVVGDFSGEAVTTPFTVIAPPPVLDEPMPTPEPEPTPLAKTGLSASAITVGWWTMAVLALGIALVLLAARRRRRSERS